jgi:hypothetical protein
MFYFEVEKGHSVIQGAGLITLEYIPMKSIVFYWGQDDGDTIISEDEYLQLRITGDSTFQRTSCRWIYDKFMYCKDWGLDAYINHSFNPNILYYHGLGIAKRNIFVNEELTINFEYILSENDTVKFIDKETNKTVTGISTDSNLYKSANELFNLLNA